MEAGGVNNFYNIIIKPKKFASDEQNIRIKDLAVPIKLSNLKGKRIAIDASNVLYEILTVATKMEKPTLFDLILKSKINKYKQLGIEQVWVFDHPKPNPLRLDKKPDICKPVKNVQLTKANILRAQEILEESGCNIRMITSRHGLEAEQVCAKLTRNSIIVNNIPVEIVDHVITCDSDTLVFGAKNILVKTTKRDVFNMYSLKDILQVSGLSREQLATVSVILGTDFNEGIRGIGPNRVVRLVKSKKYYLDNKQKKVIRYYLKD